MTPCSIWMPPWASGPVLTVSRPSLNGAACAMAGAGKRGAAAAAPAAVPARSARRLNFRYVSLRDIPFLPVAPHSTKASVIGAAPPRGIPFTPSLAKPLPPVKSRYCRARLSFFGTLATFFDALSGRNNRQQQVGPRRAAEMQSGDAAENLRWPVAHVVMQERAAAGELILEIRQPSAAAAGIDVVLAADGQRDAVAGRHDDRSRPDFHVERDHLARLERLPPGMAVIGPVRLRQLFVERAGRRAQPALAHRRMRIDGALEHHFLEVGRKNTEHGKYIGVAGRGRDKEFRRRRPGDLRLPRKRRRDKGDAVARRFEFQHRFFLRRRAGERAAGRVEIKPRPLSA